MTINREQVVIVQDALPGIRSEIQMDIIRYQSIK